MNVIICFLSSGGGKVVPAQLSEEGSARKGKAKREVGHLPRQRPKLKKKKRFCRGIEKD